MKLKETITAPIMVLVSYGLYLACYRTAWVRDALLRSGNYDLLSGIVLELMILLIPALIYAKIKGQGYSAKMNFASFRPSGSIFALCMLIIAVTGVLLIAMGYTFGGIVHSKYLLSDTYAMLLPDAEQDVFLRCMNYALIPAIAEEILYRGVLVTELSHSGVGIAVVYSSLLYAFSGFDLLEAPVYFFIGVVLALTYYVTRSLPLTVLTRLIFSLLIFYFEDAAWTLILKKANFVFLFCFCLILLLAASVMALSEAQRLYYTRGIDGEKAPKEWKLKDSLKMRLITATLSPTFLLCVGTFAFIIGT